LGEAPTDGGFYGRLNAVWTNIGAVAISNIADDIVTLAKMAAGTIATIADYRANVAQKILTTDIVWAAAAPAGVADAATVTLDFNAGLDFIWVLGGTGRALASPINQKSGQKGIIWVVQDTSGARTITSWGSAWKFPGGIKPILSSAPSAVDVISYVVNGPGYIACTFQAGFA
jgi:hypothetical protein